MNQKINKSGLIFFPDQDDFRKWLEQNHQNETELQVGFYKVGSGKPSITWEQSVEVALCFGWIDGIRRSIDGESYTIRFTPRKPSSNWSAKNIKTVERLISQGLMQPAGLAAFEKRKEDKSGLYSYENAVIELPEEFEEKLNENKKARAFFQSQPPSYRKPAMRWIMSAKQESTRIARLNQLIADSEVSRKIKPLSFGRKE